MSGTGEIKNLIQKKAINQKVKEIKGKDRKEVIDLSEIYSQALPLIKESRKRTNQSGKVASIV